MQDLKPMPRFSIVTATYNAADALPRLIKSLQAQTDQDFEWVVADGDSTDGTLELLEEAGKTLRIKIDSRPDFGIYDALNRAIKMADGDYYLTMGADDELYPETIALYKDACRRSGADLVTARIEMDEQVRGVKTPKWEWLYGPSAYISGHAVGCTIRRSLHERFGYYSQMLPIAADGLFILEAIHGGSKVDEQTFVAGRFNRYGMSGREIIGNPTELFRVQVYAGHGWIIQMASLILRIAKHRARAIVRSEG